MSRNLSWEAAWAAGGAELLSPAALFPPDYALMALYAVLTPAALLANAALIAVALKGRLLKSATHVFLVNLATADLLVASLCMPIQLSKAYSLFWTLGTAVCKFVNYIQGVAVCASVYTLAAMAAERLARTGAAPLAPPTKARAAAACAAIWLLAALVFSPLLAVAAVATETIPLLRRDPDNLTLETAEVQFCIEQWDSASSKTQFGVLSFALVYAVPGCVIVVCYASMGRTLCAVRAPADMDSAFSMQQQAERRRAARALVTLAAVFAACWLPYNTLQLLLDVGAVDAGAVATALPYALLAGHANSSINPIMYCLMTRNFQRSIKKLLCGKPSFCQARFTCTSRGVGGSSSEREHHERHKRCYLQMSSLRYRHCISYPAEGGAGRVARVGGGGGPRRVPPRTLSADMLQRHHLPDCR